MRQNSETDDLPAAIETILSQLHEAFVELEVWRQHARGSEERAALHRLTALLARVSHDIRRTVAATVDPTQENLRLDDGSGSA